MDTLPKVLIIMGAVLLGLGFLFQFSKGFNIPLGKLPGDIFIRGEKSSFYFPLVTCLVLSVLGSLLFYLWNLFHK